MRVHPAASSLTGARRSFSVVDAPPGQIGRREPLSPTDIRSENSEPPPRLGEPVRRLPIDDESEPEDGVALCLSGGGYRAMAFHVGVLRRLNEVGWLPRLTRVSSVSGGSITAGVLGAAWNQLEFGPAGTASRFAELVEGPIRALAGRTLDVGSILRGFATPRSIGEELASTYRAHLFDRATLQDLPEDPTFVINATNVGSGALLRFSRPAIADWRVGRILEPRLELAVAVACSSAFPPVLSPLRLRLDGTSWTTDVGNDLVGPEHRDEFVLTDGGVYDNLGLETAWKRCRTVIVSDAGGRIGPEHDPESDWPRHMLRVLKVIDSQVRALRKRQVIEGFRRGDRDGVYLGIRSDLADYGLEDPLPAPHPQTLSLATLPTRLAALEVPVIERLINWGYAIADAGMRRHLDRDLSRPEGFPYPTVGVG